MHTNEHWEHKDLGYDEVWERGDNLEVIIDPEQVADRLTEYAEQLLFWRSMTIVTGTAFLVVLIFG